MRIAVCLKQVPRDNTVAITPTKAIDASGIEPILNLFDEYALEAALQINDDVGGDVLAVSLGESDVVDQLRRALAMGATEALLVESAETGDVYAAAQAMAAALQAQGLPDVIVCGRNSTDHESGAFAPMLARILGWPQVTYVAKVVGKSATHLELERHLEDEIETVRVTLPAVISISKGDVEPRYPSLLRVRKFAKADVPTVATRGTVATAVLDRVPPPARKSGEIIAGADTATKVATLVDRLIADQAL